MSTTQVIVKSNRFPEIIARIPWAMQQASLRTAYRVERTAKQSMSGPKHGRHYLRAGGRIHIASAPGEAPAIDYANLVNNIFVEPEGKTNAIMFTSVHYAVYLEYGTSRMAPRPWAAPATLDTRDYWIQEISRLEDYLR